MTRSTNHPQQTTNCSQGLPIKLQAMQPFPFTSGQQSFPYQAVINVSSNYEEFGMENTASGYDVLPGFVTYVVHIVLGKEREQSSA
jgi:hypothetical protein